MNSLRALFAWLLLFSAGGSAQEPAAVAPPGLDRAPPDAAIESRRTAEQLEQLLAPVALYPDALLALMLPAATAPADIVLAARQVRESGSDRSQIEHRAWDESVKSLTHYPDVLRWMDENLEWTKQVGEAFLAQPAEVMQAVQRLRARARAAGTLVDTPEQQVLTEYEVIRIVPAQASAIYVPYYEPSLVFLAEPVAWGRPRLSFGVGLPVGSWLAFDCDWRRHTIWVGDRHRRWNGHDWRRPVVAIPAAGPTYARHPEVHAWRPPPPAARPPRPLPYRPSTELSRPGPATSPISRVTPPSAHSSPRTRPSGTLASPRQPVPQTEMGGIAPSLPTPAVAPPNPANVVPPSPDNATPNAGNRRGGPERKANHESSTGTPSYRRQGTGETRPPAANPPGVVSSPAPTQRSAPPAPRATARPAPTSSSPPASPPPSGRTRPAPPAATTPAPAPAAPPPAAAPPPRTEGDTERSIGRRPPNEHQR